MATNHFVEQSQEISKTNGHLYKLQITNLLEFIYENPDYLEKKNTDKDIEKRLNDSCDKNGQGSANKANDHEVNFAELLEKYEFKQETKKNLSCLPNGLYYIYQINGTQKAPDFTTIKVQDKIVIFRNDFDLKHSNSDTIYFNDGWFTDDIIYIINYSLKKKFKMIIGLGQNIRTEEENNQILEIRKIKEELNTKYKNSKTNLNIVFRFANQYKCNFTSELITTNYTKLIDYICNLQS